MELLSPGLLASLTRVLPPGGLLTDEADLLAYSYDGTAVRHLPDAVALPTEAQQVAEVLRLCAEAEVPVHPRGAGTGLSGGSLPVGGGLVLGLAGLRRVLAFSPDEGTVQVEAGVVTAAVDELAASAGLLYPPDPSSARVSTIGGNIAENAGGPHALKYGTTREYVLALTVALADGRIARFGAPTRKDVSGLDVVRLITGSEGQLAVILDATLRLIPRPPLRAAGLALFGSLPAAGEAVARLTRLPSSLAALEIMDEQAIALAEAYRPSGIPPGTAALLLLEGDGVHEAELRTDLEALLAACRQAGATATRSAWAAPERERLWQARHALSAAMVKIRPTKISEDVTVPRTRLADLLQAIAAIRERHGIPLVVFGHAGDGNLHPNILIDRRDPDQAARAEAAVAELFEAAIRLGGTLSGEHGIGLLKAPFLPRQFGPTELEVFQALKRALDPKGILSPGKMLAAVDAGRWRAW